MELTVTSAINVMTHAAEALHAHDGSPVVSLMAEECLPACAAALRLRRQDPADLDARSHALYGAWLCGTVLGSVSMGLHHKPCHTVGGTFNLPHAKVHAVLLPHCVAVQRYGGAASDGAHRAPSVMNAPQGIQDMVRANGAPTTPQEIGMAAGDLDHAAELAAANQYPNRRPMDRLALTNCWGAPSRASLLARSKAPGMVGDAG